MAQKGLWNLARNKALQDRGALPREEGDTIRQGMNILSSWLREDKKARRKRQKRSGQGSPERRERKRKESQRERSR